MDRDMFGSGLMSAGAGLGSLFSNWHNPADKAMDYFNQIPGQVGQYYQPYINAGQGAMSNLQGQYGGLLGDPGGMMNRIGQSYQKSPGFDFAMKQALQGANHASAAGGMAGSPQNQQQNMQLATNLANQDYNTWLSNALGMYGSGLQGEQGLMGQGYNASNQMGQTTADMLNSQAAAAYAGQDAKNQHGGGGWGSLLGGLGDIAGSFFHPKI